MRRPLCKEEGFLWSSQHSQPGIMLVSHLHPNIKGQKEGVGERVTVLLAKQMALRKGCSL